MRSGSDEILWADFVSGNDEAYKMIYVSHIQSLYKYGCHFTLNEQLVQDCIHDLFIDLQLSRSRLGKTDNIKIYLFVSLKRKIIKQLEQDKKKNTVNNDSLPFEYFQITDNADDNDLNELRIKYLEKAMEELSSRQKEAIYLKFVSGLSYEELCHVLNMNYQAARNLVYRGMEKLRESCNKNSLFLWFMRLQKLVIEKK